MIYVYGKTAQEASRFYKPKYGETVAYRSYDDKPPKKGAKVIYVDGRDAD